MAHFTASNLTAGPACAVHAGLNTQIIQYTLNETASGSTTIALCSLPAGGRVTNVIVYSNHGNLQATAGAAVSVYATIGGTEAERYLFSATHAGAVSANRGGGAGDRLTGSAVLIMRLSECAGTGTGSTQFTVVCNYLSDLRGD